MTDRKSGSHVDRSVRVVIDASYIRQQALDAMRSFIAPLNGVYAAAIGTGSDRLYSERPQPKKPA